VKLQSDHWCLCCTFSCLNVEKCCFSFAASFKWLKQKDHCFSKDNRGHLLACDIGPVAKYHEYCFYFPGHSLPEVVLIRKL